MQTLKTYLLAIVVMLSCVAGLSGQGTYQHYFNSTYQWYETYKSVILPGSPGSQCNNGGDATLWMYHHITGIDSVDGYHWYMVHSDYQEEHACTNGPTLYPPPQGTSGVNFRMREDSTGKIWIRKSDSQTVLLYDFRPGILVGDSLWMDDHSKFCAVTMIDTVDLGPERRARYWCDACGSNPNPNRDVFIVEGMGLNQGFFESDLICNTHPYAGVGMACCEKDSSRYVFDSTYVCGTPGHVIVGLDDRIESSIQLTWQRGNERILVKNADPMAQRPWAVYNVQGMRMAKGDHLPDEIYLPGLVPGMYILVAEAAVNEKPVVWRFLR